MSTWAAKASLALLAALALAATLACGGDDDDSAPTVTEAPTAGDDDATFLRALEAALAPVNEQLATLDDLRETAFGPGGSATEAAEYGAAYEQYAEDLDAAVRSVDASEALFDEHAALAAEAAESLEFARTLNEELQSDPPSNEAGLAALLYELDASNVAQGYRDACTALQRFATATSIDVDLQCLR